MERSPWFNNRVYKKLKKNPLYSWVKHLKKQSRNFLDLRSGVRGLYEKRTLRSGLLTLQK